MYPSYSNVSIENPISKRNFFKHQDISIYTKNYDYTENYNYNEPDLNFDKISEKKDISAYQINENIDSLEQETILIFEEEDNSIYSQQEEINRLKISYLFEEEDIEDFLRENYFSLSLLDEISIAIKDYFPKEELILEKRIDIESPNFTYLIISILTEDSAEEVYKQMKNFRKSWWLKNIKRTKGLIKIIPEFI